MDTPVFDASRPVAINLRTPGGVKTVRLRFPSDDEWIGRQRRRKVLVKLLGRGVSETTVANGENLDAALVAKIRACDDPELDDFEAMKVVEQSSLAEVDNVAPDGDSFTINLRVLGATTVRPLKMPSAKDVFEYRRGFARLLDPPFGRQEVTINIGSAAALYEKLITATEGCAGDVPIIHQAVAVKAAIDAMDNAFAEDRDASFQPGSGRMIRRSGFWCIGRCAGRNCAIPAFAPTRRRMRISGAATARWTAWTPLNARRRGCSSGALST
jgi:hypothetical protein